MSPRPDAAPLRRGVVPVLQTPFDSRGALDETSLGRLVEEAVAAGASGFLVPAVAGEVSCLRFDERRFLLRRVAGMVAGRVPIIAGASAPRPREAIEQARLARAVGAAAYLVAVPPALYREPRLVEPFFREVAEGAGELPLMVQDLDFTGPGLDPDTIWASSTPCPPWRRSRSSRSPRAPSTRPSGRPSGRRSSSPGGGPPAR